MPHKSWRSLAITARVPIGAVLVLAFGLVVPDQTADMLTGMIDGGYRSLLPALLFHGALAFLSFSAWYWSRAVLSARFPDMVGRVPSAPADAPVSGGTASGWLPRVVLPVAVSVGLVAVLRARDWLAADSPLVWAIPVLSIFVAALFARHPAAARAGTPAQDVVPSVDPVAWDWLPRVVFVVAAGAGLAAALRSSAWLHAGVVLVWAVPMLVYLVFRRSSRPGGSALQSVQAKGLREFPAQIRPRLWQLLRMAPFGYGLAAGLLMLGLLPLIWSVAEALLGVDGWVHRQVPAWHGLSVALGSFFPGPSGLLFAIALALPVVTALAFVADGLLIRPPLYELFPRPPVFLMIVLLVAFMPSVVSLHIVPVMHGSGALVPGDRARLGVIFTDWIAACDGGNETQTVRPVIVAVSGGASRAALWAARVLRDVENAMPPQGPGMPGIFAVSSVSGGSLGAGAWISTLAGQPDGQHCRTDPATEPTAAGSTATRADRGLSALGGDVLAAPLAAMFVDDVPRAAVGWLPAAYRRILLDRDPPRGRDRARVLERSFERLWNDATGAAWNGATGRPLAFDRGFLEITYGADRKPRRGLPLWLPNSTDTIAGRRVIPAPFISDDPVQWPFRDAGDTLGLLGADLPISTAIHNSARFAFLSPAGELRSVHASSLVIDPHHREQPVSVIDGGYFENGGLLTALELAEWLRGPQGRAAAGGRKVEPILIEVTADGERAVGGDKVVRCGGVPRDDPSTSDATGRPLQMLAPVLGLNASRGGHEGVLERDVRDAWCPRQAYFHFYLHAPPDADVPLNWTLSDTATTWIWLKAMGACDNAQEMSRLRAVATGRPADPSMPCVLTPAQ